jgi:hypothetical protein
MTSKKSKKVVLQVAATVECSSSVGIELMPLRHAASEQLKEYFEATCLGERGFTSGALGCELVCGDFRSTQVQNDVIEPASCLFVNNAEVK